MFIKKKHGSNTKRSKNQRKQDKKTTKSLEEIFCDAYGKNRKTVSARIESTTSNPLLAIKNRETVTVKATPEPKLEPGTKATTLKHEQDSTPTEPELDTTAQKPEKDRTTSKPGTNTTISKPRSDTTTIACGLA